LSLLWLFVKLLVCYVVLCGVCIQPASINSLFTFSGQAYHCTAAKTWNSQPNTVTAADSLACFKSRLKTHLFNQTFNLLAVKPV